MADDLWSTTRVSRSRYDQWVELTTSLLPQSLKHQSVDHFFSTPAKGLGPKKEPEYIRESSSLK